jgi:hypothetical protein
VTTTPVYRFLPWARRGLARGIANPDRLAANPDLPPASPDPLAMLPARPPMAISLDVDGAPATAHVASYGPGDITGIDRRVILRTDPAPGATDFEPNYLVAIEFDPPDFPWMFTPAAASSNRLRPWCVLVVLEKGPGVSMAVRADAPLPVVTIASPAQELPDLRQSWAWAHGQILEEAGSTAVDLDDGDRNLSRLLCPRRLKPETRYVACLVPAFDQGVETGLGRTSTATTIGPAWDVRQNVTGVSLPVYYFWEFATAIEDDIESMARRLHGPVNAPADLGERRVYAAAGHPGLASPALPVGARAITMYGALRPAAAVPAADTAQPSRLTDRMATIVGKRDTPTLPPPLYGEWPADQHTLPESAGWQRELNTEVGHRIAAGLGAEVVRRNQEDFVQAAWAQIGQLREANELAARARLSAAVLARLVARHVAARPADRLIPLAGPMLPGTPATGASGDTRPSLAAALGSTSLPVGATSTAYRRLASGQRQLLNRAVRTGRLSRKRGLLTLVKDAGAQLVEPTPSLPDGVTSLRDRSKLRPATPGGTSVPLSAIGLPGETTVSEVAKLRPLSGPIEAIPSAGVFFPPGELAPVISQLTGRPAIVRPGVGPVMRTPNKVTHGPSVAAFSAVIARVAGQVNQARPAPAFVDVDVSGIRSRLLSRLSPKTSVRRRIDAMVGGQGAATFDPYQGIEAFPVLPEATYRYLDALTGGWLLPKANDLEPDTAILLRTNTEFSSAFLVGMNHEMNSELLWRNYRTDQRGTPFQHFWDRLDSQADITPIHTWAPGAPLATAGLPAGADGGAGGEQIVLLVRGTLLRRYPDMVIYATTGSRQVPGETVPARGRPLFFATMQPDIQLVGFPLTEAQLAAANWWFILEQQLTTPRFGLDTDGPPRPSSWADASWAWSEVPPGGHISLDRNPIKDFQLTGASRTADKVAQNLLQHPIRVAIHRDRLLQNPGGTA